MQVRTRLDRRANGDVALSGLLVRFLRVRIFDRFELGGFLRRLSLVVSILQSASAGGSARYVKNRAIRDKIRP
jgi:hypothetical protein